MIGDFYIRKLGKEGAKYGLKHWNKTIKTYKNVSQFWTYDEKKFLEQPVYSRDYPAAQGLMHGRKAGAAQTAPAVHGNGRAREHSAMNFWLVLAVNSVTFGGLLFLLSAGFSLIFGLMRIPNLTHGSLFMLGAYFGATFIIGVFGVQMNFWLAAILATLLVAMIGALIERLLLRSCRAMRWRRCW